MLSVEVSLAGAEVSLDDTAGAGAAVWFSLGTNVNLDLLGKKEHLASGAEVASVGLSVEVSLAGAEVSLDGTDWCRSGCLVLSLGAKVKLDLLGE